MRTLFFALLLAAALPARAQLDSLMPGAKPASPSPTPMTQPTDLPPGTKLLFDLEKQFAADTAKGGGKAFASWFAEDAVELPNKKAPVQGRAAIAAMSIWDAKDFHLEWTPQGGLMMPSGSAGYTWGHYTARSTGPDGKPSTTQGRYMTLWQKQPDGHWKVALDASNEAPEDCGCTVEKPSTLTP